MTWLEGILSTLVSGGAIREGLLFLRARHAVSTVDARKLEERIWKGLQTEIRRLENENAVLRQRDDQQEQEIEALKKDLEASRSERHALRNENHSLTLKVNALQRENEALKGRVQELEQKQ